MIINSLIYLSCITVLDAIETTPFVDKQDRLVRTDGSVEETSEDHLSSTEDQGISHAKVSIKFKFQRLI